MTENSDNSLKTSLISQQIGAKFNLLLQDTQNPELPQIESLVIRGTEQELDRIVNNISGGKFPSRGKQPTPEQTATLIKYSSDSNYESDNGAQLEDQLLHARTRKLKKNKGIAKPGRKIGKQTSGTTGLQLSEHSSEKIQTRARARRKAQAIGKELAHQQCTRLGTTLQNGAVTYLELEEGEINTEEHSNLQLDLTETEGGASRLEPATPESQRHSFDSWAQPLHRSGSCSSAT